MAEHKGRFASALVKAVCKKLSGVRYGLAAARRGKRVPAGYLSVVALSLLGVTSTGVAAEASKFEGLGFGVGVSLTIDTGKNDRVDQASIVDRKVRVDKESNAIPRLLLETHYFFAPDGQFLWFKETRNVIFNRAGGAAPSVLERLDPKQQKVMWGHGPFVAIQAGNDDQVINAIGLGWMVGLKRSEKADDTSSFNFGVGYMVDPSVRILGKDFKANAEPPGNEMEIRYRTKAQGGIVLLSSFSF